MTNSTLGPGITISRNDMAVKARRLSVGTIRLREHSFVVLLNP